MICTKEQIDKIMEFMFITDRNEAYHFGAKAQDWRQVLDASEHLNDNPEWTADDCLKHVQGELTPAHLLDHVPINQLIEGFHPGFDPVTWGRQDVGNWLYETIESCTTIDGREKPEGLERYLIRHGDICFLESWYEESIHPDWDQWSDVQKREYLLDVNDLL